MSGRAWAIGCGVAGALVLFGVFAIGVCAGTFYAVTSVSTAEYDLKSKRGAVALEVNRIRDAVLLYESVLGALPGPIGAEAAAPGKEPVPWVSNPGWEAIQYQPYQDTVTAAYWVEQTGTEFRVVARCDLDGDGAWAEWVADRAGAARLTTPEDAY